jgi:hypothetical protein
MVVVKSCHRNYPHWLGTQRIGCICFQVAWRRAGSFCFAIRLNMRQQPTPMCEESCRVTASSSGTGPTLPQVAAEELSHRQEGRGNDGVTFAQMLRLGTEMAQVTANNPQQRNYIFHCMQALISLYRTGDNKATLKAIVDFVEMARAKFGRLQSRRVLTPRTGHESSQQH